MHILFMFFHSESYCMKHCWKLHATLSFEDVLYVGGSSVLVNTEADSSDVTDGLHHVMPSTGMFDYCEIRPCHVL